RAGICRAGGCGRMMHYRRWRRRRITEAEHQAGRRPQIILPVVTIIGELCKQVVDLAPPYAQVPGGMPIHAETSVSRQRILVEVGTLQLEERCVRDKSRGEAGSQARAPGQGFNEGGPSLVSEREARAEQEGVQPAVNSAHVIQRIRAKVASQAKPVVDVS